MAAEYVGNVQIVGDDKSDAALTERVSEVR
jgi:hypothetical protein